MSSLAFLRQKFSQGGCQIAVMKERSTTLLHELTNQTQAVIGFLELEEYDKALVHALEAGYLTKRLYALVREIAQQDLMASEAADGQDHVGGG